MDVYARTNAIVAARIGDAVLRGDSYPWQDFGEPGSEPEVASDTDPLLVGLELPEPLGAGTGIARSRRWRSRRGAAG